MKKEEESSLKKILECSHCGKEFKYESERKRHEQSHVPQFECKVCCKKFSFLSAVRRHEKQHERSGSVQCHECNREFLDELLLKRHMQYAHKGIYTCTKCGTSFSSELALKSHAKRHKPKSERRFRCSYNGCGKMFNFPHHLKHHELTHTNSKQHYCSACGKGFIQSHHLKTHLKSHKPNDEWLLCTVTDCNKKFATEYARKRHLATHKIKSDHRISNSADDYYLFKESKKDTILCASCGELILRKLYIKHSEKCIPLQKEPSKDSPVNILERNLENTLNLLNKNEAVPTEIDTLVTIPKKVTYNDIRIDNNCKAVLGGCIVSGDSEINENCLCAQITTSVDDCSDLITCNEDTDNVVTLRNEVDIDTSQNKNMKNACVGCACAKENNSCLNYNETPSVSDSNEVVPGIEYRVDGTVKIKETFDIDIPEIENNFKRNVQTEMNNVKFVPFNSCKAVLGNCIVSGNATIGEGCLCAKMCIDEQMSAQEIEEITPHPNVT